MTTMASDQALRQILLRIDGRGYKAYKEIGGRYRFPGFTLAIDSVQSDPFAPPSRLRALIPPAAAALPQRLIATESRAVGVSCFLARAFAHHASKSSARRGPVRPSPTPSAGQLAKVESRSGEIRIEAPGQQVLENTAVQIHADGTVEARFTVGLPAQGRRVLGRRACRLLLEDVPHIITSSLPANSHPASELWRHAAANEDADALRAMLAGQGLIAFVSDGAILPRASGVDDRPLRADSVVPFRSPDSLKVAFTLPHAGAVTGMGIPAGVTMGVSLRSARPTWSRSGQRTGAPSAGLTSRRSSVNFPWANPRAVFPAATPAGPPARPRRLSRRSRPAPPVCS